MEFIVETPFEEINLIFDYVATEEDTYNLVKDKLISYNDEDIFSLNYDGETFEVVMTEVGLAVQEINKLIIDGIIKYKYFENYQNLSELKNIIDEYYNEDMCTDIIRNRNIDIVKLLNTCYRKLDEFEIVSLFINILENTDTDLDILRELHDIFIQVDYNKYLEDINVIYDTYNFKVEYDKEGNEICHDSIDEYGREGFLKYIELLQKWTVA